VAGAFAGPLASVPEDLAEDLVAVLREALSNVARHASATTARVDVEVGLDLVLVVEDDGRGFVGDARGSGVRNMRHRAQTHGGALALEPCADGGTRLEWRVPLGS
jgi:signal transduction histidine kinase